MKKTLTVFTPSYNRAHTLERLYHSLIVQTNRDFVWLVIDDGSTDNTEEIISRWIQDGKIEIKYYKQENGGKSSAHNKGVELTETELFTCVDSDDYLTNNAVDEIIKCWKTTDNNEVGILAFKKTEDKIITKLPNADKENIHTTLKNAYDKLGLSGDTMLVFKTDIICKFRFPCFENEKFVPEAYLYDLIDREGKLLVLPKPLYICEYLDDGYTKNMARLLKNNPNGYLAYINQRLRFDTGLKERFFDTMRYIAMARCVRGKKIIRDSVYPLLTILAYPAGVMLYLKKYKNV